VARSSATHSGT